MIFGITLANIYEKLGSAQGKDLYLLITFFTAFVLSAAFAIAGAKKITKNDLLFGIVIAIPNYFSSRFLLLTLNHVDAVLVYPMYSVTTLVVITLAGILLFKEAFGKKKMAAMGMILAALCLLNI